MPSLFIAALETAPSLFITTHKTAPSIFITAHKTAPSLFITALAIVLSFHLSGVEGGHSAEGRVVRQFDYVCRNAVGLRVCHPIYDNRFIHCLTSHPVEYTCKGRFKFSSLRQKCTFPQYADCKPILTPAQAARITCPRLVDPAFGTFHCSDGNRYDSLCLLACVSAYRGQGLQAVQCALGPLAADGPTGRWSGRPGTCVPREGSGVGTGVGTGVTTEKTVVRGECRLADLEETPIRCHVCEEDNGRCPDGAICRFMCSADSRQSAIAECKDREWIYHREPCLAKPNNNNKDKDNDNKNNNKNDDNDRNKNNNNDRNNNKNNNNNQQLCTEIDLPPVKSGLWNCSGVPAAAGDADFSGVPDIKCRLECDAGFVQENASVSCVDGSWRVKETPQCPTLKYCPLLSPPTNGYLSCSCDLHRHVNNMDVSTVAAHAGTYCKFNCNPGYKLIGPALTNCTQRGVWNAPIASCQRLCHASQLEIDIPENGRWVCTGVENLNCQLVCEEGYDAIGGIAVCSDGIWHKSGDSVCFNNLKYCPLLLPPTDGYLSCSCDLHRHVNMDVSTVAAHAGTYCKVNCNPGYKLIGPALTNCTQQGVWNAQSASCQRLCHASQLEVDVPENGRWVCTGVENLSCQLVCEEGYDAIKGAAICSDGIWHKSGDSVCFKTKYCPLLQPPADGYLSCSCDLHHHVNNMDVSIVPAHAGTYCKFNCNPGYKLIGSAFANCTQRGVWNAPSASCQKLCHASQLNLVDNGFWICEGVEDLKCSLMCRDSFKGSVESARCKDGVWNLAGVKPSCEESYCSLLSARRDGQIKCIGPPKMDSFVDPTTTKVRGNSACKLECAADFAVNGTELTFCKSRGEWESELGVCARQCDENQLNEVDHGKWVCDDSSSLSSSSFLSFSSSLSCRVQCDRGYELSRKILAECAETPWNQIDTGPDWSGRELCSRVLSYCPLLPPPADGYLSCRCDLDLDHDHGLVDVTTVAAHAGTYCKPHCHLGYKYEGPEWVNCSSQGDWTGNVGSCQKLCDPDQLPQIRNGRWKCTGVANTICSLRCDESYVGNFDSVSCESGNWNANLSVTPANAGVTPACVEVRCPLISDRADGSIECESATAKTLTPTESTSMSDEAIDPSVIGAKGNSICRLTCNSGFHLRGAETSRCSGGGTWDVRLGNCEISCDESSLAAVENGKWHCASEEERASGGGSSSLKCSLRCNPGYETAAVKASCLDGVWARPAREPVCSKTLAECPLLPTPGNGAVTCSRDNVPVAVEPAREGTSCRLECRSGFEPIGSTRTRCSSPGLWTERLGICRRRCSEKDLPAVANGAWRCNVAAVGEDDRLECALACQEHYEGTIGRVFCTAGSWNINMATTKNQQQQQQQQKKQQPRCEKVRCSSLAARRNGVVKCWSSTGEQVDPSVTPPRIYSACQLECDASFALRGTPIAFCQADGSYNAELGSCQRKCEQGQLKPVTNGVWRCSGTIDLLRCDVRCDEGYDRSDSSDDDDNKSDAKFTCAEGRWNSFRPPVCRRMVCPVLPKPADGTISCSNDKRYAGTTCVIICDRGFSLAGNAVVLCTGNNNNRNNNNNNNNNEDVKWNNNLGQCERSSPLCNAADIPIKVANGSWHCSGDEPMSCLLKCDRSFRSAAHYNIFCLDGVWSVTNAIVVPKCVGEGNGDDDNNNNNKDNNNDNNDSKDNDSNTIPPQTTTLPATTTPPAATTLTPSTTPQTTSTKPPTRPPTTPPSPVLPRVPLYRSSSKFPLKKAPTYNNNNNNYKTPALKPTAVSYCLLPKNRPKGNLICEGEQRRKDDLYGRVPLGANCLLKCKGSFSPQAKCTVKGWVPSLDSLACPGFTLYTYETTCTRPTVNEGSLDCGLTGNEIPAKDHCKLTCHDGFKPVWANVSTCLDDGYWDNYLNCIQK